MRAVLRWLDGQQQRRRWLAFPFAVLKKFSEDQSGNLAALIAYYAFFSIFPLLLVFTTVLGFVLQGNPSLEHKVLGSALGQFPIIGNQAIGGQLHPLTGSIFGVVVGGALALWSGLGVAKTAQTAFNTVYAVPKTDRPNFLKSTLHALLLVSVVGTGLVVTTLVSGLVTGAGSFGLPLGPVPRVAAAILAIALNTAIFVWAFNWLTVRQMTWRDALPGAVFAAVLFYLLELAGTALVAHKLKGAQGTYGTFATVIGLLSWFYLLAQVTLVAAQINVVKQYKLWPRGLTDAPATEADFRAYEAYADRETYQQHEEVSTDFDASRESRDVLSEVDEERRRDEHARRAS